MVIRQNSPHFAVPEHLAASRSDTLPGHPTPLHVQAGRNWWQLQELAVAEGPLRGCLDGEALLRTGQSPRTPARSHSRLLLDRQRSAEELLGSLK